MKIQQVNSPASEMIIGRQMRELATREGHAPKLPGAPRRKDRRLMSSFYMDIYKQMPEEWTMTRDLTAITGRDSSRTSDMLRYLEEAGLIESRRLSKSQYSQKQWRPL